MTLQAYDDSGKELSIQKVNESETGLTLNEHQWLYRLYGKPPLEGVTLQSTQMEVTWKNRVIFTFDLSPFGFNLTEDNLGVPYKMGLLPLDVPGLGAQVATITYIEEGGLYGFEVACQADTALRGIYFHIANDLNPEGSDRTISGGDSYRDENGLLVSRALAPAPLSFPIELRAERASIRGIWELKITPNSTSSD